MANTKKKPSLLNRIISWILIIIIIISSGLLLKELYVMYQQWKLKNEFNQLVVQDDLINPNWEELKKINEDIVAWIAVPNTPINYPILQGDDNDYYLYRTATKENNKFGSIFMDYRANPDFSDYNTLLYGHNVAGNKGMFSRLTRFCDPQFFSENPNFYILTPNGNFEAQVLSVNKLLDGDNVYTTEFYNEQQVVDLVDSIRSTAVLSSQVPFNLGDKMVTLSTCDLAYGLDSPNRITVSAKLVPYVGEVRVKLE